MELERELEGVGGKHGIASSLTASQRQSYFVRRERRYTSIGVGEPLHFADSSILGHIPSLYKWRRKMRE